MDIVRRVEPMKEIVRRARARGLKVGLVPTMGSLHEGHLSLTRRISEMADINVVSVFVNPTQFGTGEDLDAYPRDLTRDADLCISEGVDYLFAPQAEEIYPPGPRTYVEVSGLSDRYEGASRPGHFRGVTTVVLKLLEIVKPHLAAFGQKDAQQSVIVQRMVEDLMLDVEVLVLPIIRDTDGVALSSRNRYLSREQREAARAIPAALEAATSAAGDATEPGAVLDAAREVLEAQSLLELDYLELVDRTTFEPLERFDREGFLIVAARCGETRLLDNTILSPAAD